MTTPTSSIPSVSSLTTDIARILAEQTKLSCTQPNSLAVANPGVNILQINTGNGSAVSVAGAVFQNELNAYCQHIHPVRLWGIEANEELAKQARQQLNRVINAPIEKVNLTENYFELIIFNQLERRGEQDRARESDLHLLHRVSTSVADNGLLVYIATKEEIESVQEYLTRNFYRLDIAKIPDPHYEALPGLVIIGQRQQHLGSAVHSNYSNLARIQKILDDPQTAPSLTGSKPHYQPFHTELTVPYARKAALGAVVRRVTDEEIIKAINTASAWDLPGLQEQMEPHPDRARFRPLEPLRRGHICIMAANGQLDNIPLYDETGALDPIVIKGSSRKIAETIEEDDEFTKQQDSFVAEINVLNLRNGQISNISESAEDLEAFMNARQPALEKAVREYFPPLIDPNAPEHREIRQRIASLARTPIGKQAPSTVTTAVALKQGINPFLIGQPGSGKTMIAIGAVTAANYSKMLVVTPSHNVDTWIDEIKQTTPNARVRVVNGIGDPNFPKPVNSNLAYAATDLVTIQNTPASPERPLWVILKKDSSKLSYPTKVSARLINPVPEPGRRHVARLYREDNHLRALPEELLGFAQAAIPTCPHCWTMFAAYRNFHSNRKSRCQACGEFLAGPNCQTSAQRRYSWADYISRKMPRWADVFIVDEAHQYKEKSSAQGEVIRRLAQKSKRTMALTGTLIGGKATDAFYLLTGFSPPFFQQFGYQERGRFLKRYGREERSFPTANNEERKTKIKELNGFHPSLLNHFWGSAIFTRIHDIAPDLPDADVFPVLIHLDRKQHQVNDGTDLSQHEGYEKLENALTRHLASFIRMGSLKPAGQMLQELLTYPENCWMGTSPLDPQRQHPIVNIPALPEDHIYPKEQQLIEILKKERAEGRKCLIYCTHTQNRDTTARISRILEAEGITARIMKQSADKRLRWLQETARKVDAVICHPKTVETGLNLLEFPTIIWYEIEYSMYTVEQASARSHRINQNQQVRVYYLAYANTMQERALRIVATKADTSRMVYGELSSDGLSAFNPQNQDLKTLIVRQIYERIKSSERSDIDLISQLTLQNILNEAQQDDIASVFQEHREKQKNFSLDNSVTLSAIDYNSLIYDFEIPELDTEAVETTRTKPIRHWPAHEGGQQLSFEELLAATF